MNAFSDVEINRMAQTFFEASHIPMNMSDKELVVNGLKAVFDKLATGYTVELGDARFTQHQWEVVQTYAKGYAMSAVQDYQDAEPPSMQEQVQAFHRAFGHTAPDDIQPMPDEEVPLVIELIREEFQDELVPALRAGDMVETVDALIDILYVTFGALVRMGVPAKPFFDEVQRSNMSKLGADGKPIIAGPNDPDGIFEGRVKKGPGYFRPNIAAMLDGMIFDQTKLYGLDD